MTHQTKEDIKAFFALGLLGLLFWIMFFSALDKSYTNRAKAAGYYCKQCLTDAECEKYCNK